MFPLSHRGQFHNKKGSEYTCILTNMITVVDVFVMMLVTIALQTSATSLYAAFQSYVLHGGVD